MDNDVMIIICKLLCHYAVQFELVTITCFLLFVTRTDFCLVFYSSFCTTVTVIQLIMTTK